MPQGMQYLRLIIYQLCNTFGDDVSLNLKVLGYFYKLESTRSSTIIPDYHIEIIDDINCPGQEKGPCIHRIGSFGQLIIFKLVFV